MKLMQRILVPVDFSSASTAAFQAALDLAERLEASIEVLHAWGGATSVDALFPGPAYVELARRVAEGMDAFVARFEIPKSVVVTTRLQQGVAWELITQLSPNYDLIVMGTRGHTGFKRVLMGSVTARVVQHAECPVMTLRAPEDVSEQPIVTRPDEETIVRAVFPEDANLPEVFRGLDKLGITADDVSIVMNEDVHDEDFAALDKTKALEGATAGGVVGGIVGGAVGMGLIATGGLGLAVFGPALGFAATGSLFGGLLGRNVPEDKAQVLKDMLADGSTLLAVHVNKPDAVQAVRQTLVAQGGEFFEV